MSRVGRNPIVIPEGVKVNISANHITVEGPNGKVEKVFHLRMKVEVKDGQVSVKRLTDSKMDKSLHGLTRTLIANMVFGVTQGYIKELELHGVGYRAKLEGKSLGLSLGFSHLVDFPVPDEVKIEVPKPTQIIVRGTDKQVVGETAAEIRAFLKPEPYKGKGIRYKGEYVRRKAGKAVA